LKKLWPHESSRKFGIEGACSRKSTTLERKLIMLTKKEEVKQSVGKLITITSLTKDPKKVLFFFGFFLVGGRVVVEIPVKPM